MTREKIFSVVGHPIDGFHLDEAFYDRVIDRVENFTDIPRDADTLEVVTHIISGAVAEFLQTFEVKKQ